MNYLKKNIGRRIYQKALEESLDPLIAFLRIAQGGNGFLWDLYDYVERKYGLQRTIGNDSSFELTGFLNSLDKLTNDDIDRISATMNEHCKFELMLFYSVENLDNL